MHNKDGVGEVRLTDSQVSKMIELSKERPSVYFLFRLMGLRGFRVSAITGDRAKDISYQAMEKFQNPDGSLGLRFKMQKKHYPAEPGLLKEDVTREGVWVHWKGQGSQFKYLSPELARDLFEYSSGLKKGERIVPFTRQRAYQLTLEYAKLAGVDHWQRVHPHRFRHFFGTSYARKTARDPWKVKSLMGHKDLRSTATYVEELSPEEEQDALAQGDKLVSG